MSHRDSVTEPPPGLRGAGGQRRRRRWPPWRTASAASTRPVPPRGRAHAQGHGRPHATSSTRPAAARPRWTPASIIEESIAKHPRAGGRRQGHLRALRRGRLLGRRAARAQGHRRPAHLRLRRPGHDAQGRGRAGRRDVRGHLRASRWCAVDASDRFLDKLAGVTEPERKRKIIGEEFIRCFEEEARKLTDAKFLVQGTLYSDVIESGTRQAAKIKSHHNVGGLPEEMDFELVEPLR